MKTRHLIAPLLSTLLLISSCGDDKPSNSFEPDTASGTVTSAQANHIETPDGAYIDVPVGAVPLTLDSTAGTMIFSVEKVQGNVEAEYPDDVTPIGDVYRFGPEGFVFAEPVEVAIPVEGDYEVGEVMLTRINPTTRQAEFYSSDYDPVAGVIRAQTVELSEWEAVVNAVEREGKAWAKIRVQGGFEAGEEEVDETILACATNFVPRYPSDSVLSQNICGADSSRPGTWTLPQGTYTFCITFHYTVQAPTTVVTYQRTMMVPNVEIINDAGWSDAINYTMTFNQSHFDALSDVEERCECVKRSTPSPGTGDLQVTLTWYNDFPLDLDLWVTDPTGEKCYYGNTPTESGGVLDRDNLCGSYENGDPENIFWADAPNGEYIVDVDWYSNCGDDQLEAQAYTVRLAGSFAPITKTGRILKDETVRIGTFTLSSNRVSKVSFDPVVVAKTSPAEKPKK